MHTPARFQRPRPISGPYAQRLHAKKQGLVHEAPNNAVQMTASVATVQGTATERRRVGQTRSVRSTRLFRRWPPVAYPEPEWETQLVGKPAVQIDGLSKHEGLETHRTSLGAPRR